MKGLIKRLVAACMLVAATTMTATAKDYQVALACDPDGAAVYLNGELVSPTTPRIYHPQEENGGQDPDVPVRQKRL